MAIIRVHKNKNYTVMSNTHLRDKNLSLKAKGLLSVMLSLPDDWDYSISGLCAICKENETAVKSAINELKSFNYVVIKRFEPTKENGGRIRYEYDVYEEPQGAKQDAEKQGVEILGVEFQGVENQGQLNTDIQNTNKSNTENKKHALKEGSSFKVSTHASSPNGAEGCHQKKTNRYIPPDYTYEQLREHIRPVYDNRLKTEYGFTDSDTPLDRILDITIEFCKMYEDEFWEKHPVLSDRAYENIIDNFMNPPYIMDDKDCMFDFEYYMSMAKKYFKTEYNKRGNYKGTIQKSFSHFMSSTVRENLFYKACY